MAPSQKSPSPPTANQSLLAAQSLLAEFIADTGHAERIERVADLLAGAFASGRKAMICGNGGSAADAMHFAEELTGRFRADRRALPAIACTDVGHITCTANDYGFDRVFARWVEALAQPGDVLLVLSTSGNSPNILLAVEAAKSADVRTVALLGRDGGRLAGRCDHEWIVGTTRPPTPADRIQEIHMLVLHTLIECIERRMFEEKGTGD